MPRSCRRGDPTEQEFQGKEGASDKASHQLTRKLVQSSCVDCFGRVHCSAMEPPGTSGRPAAGFASLTAWPLSCSNPAASSRQHEPCVSQTDGSSQQSSAATRVPAKAWLPSFRRGSSGSNKWSSRPFSHKAFTSGLGTGAGGSMLVSL